jgi:arylsulfatase A-like enzyme
MSGDYRSIAPFIKESVGYETPPPLDPNDLAHLLALYDGEIAYVDAEIGRLFDHLRESGVYDDTMIVVTSDHGEEFMEHGSLEGHQWALYEEVIRVPLMMRLPQSGCRSGKRRLRGVLVEETVSTVGIAGTILDCVGIERNSRPTFYSLFEGQSSFSPAIGTLLLDLTVRRAERTVDLRTDSHKLIVNADGS